MRVAKQLAIVACTALWLTAGYLSAEQATQGADTGEAATTPAAATFPQDQVEQLVAPIALYPDALIAQILMASTYPLDVVQAARWIDDHKDLEGDALEKAAGEQGWDPSVQALVFFPEVLDFMSENLDWTQDLGDAVLAQQQDVTDAVQKLRHDAQAAGNLETTEQQKVETEGDTIIVQPADPQTVYVPSYSPSEVYGYSTPPATTYYPATYNQSTSSDSDALVGFGAGALVGGLLTAAILWNNNDSYRIYYGGPGYYGGRGYWSGGNYWSGGWREPRNINVDRNVNIERNVERGDININKGIVGNEIKAGKWEHNPSNRGGVRYRNKDVENRFANADRERHVDRDIARGRDPDRRPARPDGAKRPGQGDAPKLSPAQRERLDRGGAGGGKLADARPGTNAPKRADSNRPAAKATTKKPAAKKPSSRPAKVSSKTKDAVARRPADRSSSGKRTTHRSSKSSAFNVDRGNRTRAASNRGSQSRSRSHSGGRGGGGRGGGGRRR